MNLAYKAYRSAQPSTACIVFAHGLLGNKRNWHSVAHLLASSPVSKEGKAALPIDSFAVDVRNHGDSPHHADHSLEAMADDLATFVSTVARPTYQKVVVVGHSMSGVVTLFEALRAGNRSILRDGVAAPPAAVVDAYAAVDSAPFRRPPSFRVMSEQIQSLAKMDLSQLRNVHDVEAAVAASTKADNSWMVKYFASNVVRDEGELGSTKPSEYRWQCNMDAITRSLREDRLLWGQALDRTYRDGYGSMLCRVDVPVHVTFAADSAYYTPEAVESYYDYFANPSIDVLSTGGHFHHVYNMRQYSATLVSFLVQHGFTQYR